MPQENARERQLLRDYYIFERRRAACLLDPNAHCPVCGARVFYYENAFGSRVFFDDLGNGWPKHPCTDNGRSVNRTSNKFMAFRGPNSVASIMAAAHQINPEYFDVFDTQTGLRRQILRIMEIWVFDEFKLIFGLTPSKIENIQSMIFEDPEDLVEVDDLIEFDDLSVRFLKQDNFNIVTLKRLAPP